MVNNNRWGRSTAGKPVAGGKGFESTGMANKKGEKGAGKSEGEKGAIKGSGKGKKGEGENANTMQVFEERHVVGAKMVQELEADMFSKIPMGTLKERKEATKQRLEAMVKKHSDMGCADMFSKIPMGTLNERKEATKQRLEAMVKKHSDMGCAVVSFKDQSARDSVMRLAGEKTKSEIGNDDWPTMQISDVQFRRHIDKAKDDEIQKQFRQWRRTALQTPLPLRKCGSSLDYYGYHQNEPVLLNQLVNPMKFAAESATISVLGSSTPASGTGETSAPESPRGESVEEALPPIAMIAIAVCAYAAEAGGYLSVRKGDLVEVLVQHQAPGDSGCAWPTYIYAKACPKSPTSERYEGWLPPHVAWQRYLDASGRAWAHDSSTGDFVWEDEM